MCIKMSIIKEKNIIVGVTGGIAAYKSCELVRGLIKQDASVQVVMTKNATEFITPLTLQTLSGNKVAINTFDLEWESEIGHITLADNADLIVVAPATANFIGKVASGIADSLLSTVVLATKAPIVLCPAMNVNMYENPAVHDMVIRGNRFGGSGIPMVFSVWRGDGAAAVPPHRSEEDASAKLIKNIVIENNVFERSIYLFDAQNCKLSSNKFKPSGSKENLFLLRNVENIQTDDPKTVRYLDR